MEVFLGLLAFGVLIWVINLLQKGVSRGFGAIEGAVTGNTRSRGLRAVRLQTDFDLPVPPTSIVEKLLELLELPEKASFDNKPYLGGISEDRTQMIVKVGNPIQTSLEFIVDANPTATGSSGMATAVTWRESDYLVTATNEIERLHKYVHAAVESLGGTWRESSFE